MLNTLKSPAEFYNTIQGEKIIKLRFDIEDCWFLYPLIFVANNELGILVKSEESLINFKDNNQKILIKVNDDIYDYLVICEYSNVSSVNKDVVILSILDIHKSHTIKPRRISLNLSCNLKTEEDTFVNATIKNLSMNGMILDSNVNIGLASDIQINFKATSNNYISSTTKILKKSKIDNISYNYGIRFFNINQANKELLEDFIDSSKNNQNTNNNNSDIALPYKENITKSKILIYSKNFKKISYLKSTFIRMGLRKFYIVDNLESLRVSVIEKIPQLIILDGLSLSRNEFFLTVKEITELLNINIIFITNYIDENLSPIPDDIIPLYLPLVDGELEDTIFKYL